MANEWSISFDATGVEPPKTGDFELLPEGMYKAKVTAIEPDVAKKPGREGELNDKLTIKLMEPGVDLERFTWIPRPVTKSTTDAATKAAAFGRAQWVAFALSAGATKASLTGALNISKAEVLGAEIYVEIAHEESTKKRADGTPYINANVKAFVTKEEYLASKTVGSTNGVMGTAKPASSNGATLSSIFGQR